MLPLLLAALRFRDGRVAAVGLHDLTEYLAWEGPAPRAPFQPKVPSLHPDLPRYLVSTQLLPLRGRPSSKKGPARATRRVGWNI